MKSRKTILGIIALMVAGSLIATGAVVNYLSNEVSETVTVESPFEIDWCNHYDFENCQNTTFTQWGTISDDSNWVAGGYGTFWAKITNKAPSDIDGSMEITIKTKYDGSYLVMNGDEITQFDIRVKNFDYCQYPNIGPFAGGATVDVLNDIGYTIEGNGNIELVFTIPLNTVPAGTSYIAEIDFGLSGYAHPGNYEISAQIV